MVCELLACTAGGVLPPMLPLARETLFALSVQQGRPCVPLWSRTPLPQRQPQCTAERQRPRLQKSRARARPGNPALGVASADKMDKDNQPVHVEPHRSHSKDCA